MCYDHTKGEHTVELNGALLSLGALFCRDLLRVTSLPRMLP